MGIVSSALDALRFKDTIIYKENIAYGSKYRTGYAWILSNTKKINSSIKIKGQLGIWNINNIETNNM